MDPVWPATLPPLTEQSNFNEAPPDTLLRSNTDTGPAKLRRRSTAGIRPLGGSMLMTKDQLAILEAFFLTDLVGGALPFTSTHPRTGAAIRANLKRPTWKHRSGQWWDASIELEVLP